MEALWSLVSVNQLIALMPLMDIKFPANAFLLFQVLSFVNGDVYLLNELYDRTFGSVLKFKGTSAPYNQQFELLGKSKS